MAASDYFGGSNSNTLSGKEGRKRRLKRAAQAYLQAQQGLGTGSTDATPFTWNTGMLPGVGPFAQSATDMAQQQLRQQVQSYAGGTNTGTGNGTTGLTGSSGGGAIGGAGGAAGTLPTDTMSGFAGNYAPIGLDILYSNPEVLARDSLKGMGINPNDGLMSLAEDQAKYLQFLAMMGLGTGNENSITPENYLNFVNDYYKNQMTPGAASPDVWGMISSVLQSPEGSALQAYLTDGTPQEQAEAMNTLVNVATSSLPPVFRKAIMAKMEDQTSDWLSNKSKGKEGLLSEFLKPGGLLG